MEEDAARLFLVCALSCTASNVAAADAAASYPNRPIHFTIAFVPGGRSDVLSQLLGHNLTERCEQAVVVDNRGSSQGDGGRI